LESLLDFADEDKILEEVKIIKNRHLALELIREMCMLSHVDNILSDEETLFIGKVGIALGVEMEKIEQISNWVIDHIFWLEQAKVIFEER
jgi:protein-arginine kinase